MQRKRDDHQSGSISPLIKPKDEVTIDAGGGADLMFINEGATSMLDDDQEPISIPEKKSYFSNDCENITTKTNPFNQSSLQTTPKLRNNTQLLTQNKFFGNST